MPRATAASFARMRGSLPAARLVLARLALEPRAHLSTTSFARARPTMAVASRANRATSRLFSSTSHEQTLPPSSELRDRHRASTVEDYTATIKLWSILKDWRAALTAFDQMLAANITPDLQAFDAVWQACSRCGETEVSLSILEKLREASHVRPSKQVHSRMIMHTLAPPHAAERSDGPEALHERAATVAHGLLTDQLAHGIFPSPKAAMFVAAALIRLGNIHRAADLVDELRAAGVRPEARLYTKVIHAVVRGSGGGDRASGEERAFALAEALRTSGVPLQFETTVTLAYAAAQSKDDRAQNILSEMLSEMVAACEKRQQGSAANSNDSPADPDDAEKSVDSIGGRVDGRVAGGKGAKGAVSFAVYRSSLSILQEHEQWSRVLSIYSHMIADGHTNDPIPHAMALNAYEKLGQVDEALALLEHMVDVHGVAPGSYHFCAAITACGKAGRVGRAVELFDSMQTRFDVKPSRITYTAAIQACADSGWWRTAVDLYVRFESDTSIQGGSGDSPLVTFNAILDAIAPFTSSRAVPPPPPTPTLPQSTPTPTPEAPPEPQTAATTDHADSDLEERRVLAELVWQRALEVGAYGDFESWMSNGRSLSARFDLHAFSCGAGEMAVRWWLQRLQPQLLARQEAKERMPTLCIVTGKGKTRPTHQQRDLRQSVEELLIDVGVPTITPHHDARYISEGRIALRHEGAVFVDAEAIAWMARLNSEAVQIIR